MKITVSELIWNPLEAPRWELNELSTVPYRADLDRFILLMSQQLILTLLKQITLKMMAVRHFSVQ